MDINQKRYTDKEIKSMFYILCRGDRYHDLTEHRQTAGMILMQLYDDREKIDRNLEHCQDQCANLIAQLVDFEKKIEKLEGK